MKSASYLSNGGSETTLLLDLMTEQSYQMRQSVRTNVKALNLHENRIDPDLIGVYSLIRGGTMVVKLQKVSDIIYKIRQMGINGVLRIQS